MQRPDDDDASANKDSQQQQVAAPQPFRPFMSDYHTNLYLSLLHGRPQDPSQLQQPQQHHNSHSQSRGGHGHINHNFDTYQPPPHHHNQHSRHSRHTSQSKIKLKEPLVPVSSIAFAQFHRQYNKRKNRQNMNESLQVQKGNRKSGSNMNRRASGLSNMNPSAESFRSSLYAHLPIRQDPSAPFNALLPSSSNPHSKAYLSPVGYKAPISQFSYRVPAMPFHYELGGNTDDIEPRPKTDFLLHKAFTDNADYSEVKQWYARKLRSDDEGYIEKSFLEDVEWLLGRYGLRPEKRVFYIELRRQVQGDERPSHEYADLEHSVQGLTLDDQNEHENDVAEPTIEELRTARRQQKQAINRAVKASRTPAEKEIFLDRKRKYQQLLKARRAANFELEISRSSLLAMEESGSFIGDKKKEKSMAEWREEVDELEDRLERLDELASRMRRAKRRDKETRKDNVLLRGGIGEGLESYNSEDDSDDDEAGEEDVIFDRFFKGKAGDGFDEAWRGAAGDILKALTGIGGLATGYISSEDVSEDGW